MSQWPSVKAKRLLAALLKLGWQVKRQPVPTKPLPAMTGQILFLPSMTVTKLGQIMLARVAKHTGLVPNDL